MNAIAKKENAYKEMYNLLIEFELKITALSAFIKQQKNGKANLTSVRNGE